MIGIIGGNGVVATNRLLTLIEEKCTRMGAFRDAHHPEILVWQATQVPSRSMFLEGRGPSFINDYIKIGKMLKNCGCTELCMCCNTAHYAIDELSSKIQLPFINIIKEVADVIKTKYNTALILCSDGCRITHLYDNYITKLSQEINILYPDDSIQATITKGICNAKNSSRFNPEDIEHPEKLFFRACQEMITKFKLDPHNSCIIGGCTDINNVFRPKSISNIDYIDSLDVLADAIVTKYFDASNL